ncbi:MAG: hypothetical protein C4558_04355 [Dehalococcoidia bacterium]|nr:MAG: hypothetical protein C4558_04355 [Dehalococcoidia bacterium]
MEWAVLALFALAACAFIALPRSGDTLAGDPAGEAVELAAERDSLLLALRELDEDASAGRISPADRLDGRRALGPRLREVTEALRAAGADQAATR